MSTSPNTAGIGGAHGDVDERAFEVGGLEDLATGALHGLDAEPFGVLAGDDRYRETTTAEYVVGLPLFTSEGPCRARGSLAKM